jgi:hypothetical protein
VLRGGGTVDESLEFLLGMGMAKGSLGRVDASDRDEIVAQLRLALSERQERGVGVRLGTGALLVSASRSD